jgi:hypothetical protein
MNGIDATMYSATEHEQCRYAFVTDNTGYYILRKLSLLEYVSYYHNSSVDEIRLDAIMNHWLVLKRTDSKEEAQACLEEIFPSFDENSVHHAEAGEGLFTAWFVKKGQYFCNKALQKKANIGWQ